MKKQSFKHMAVALMLMVLQYLTVYPFLIAVGSQIFDQSVLRYLWLLPLCSWLGYGSCLILKKLPVALIRCLLIVIVMGMSLVLFQEIKQVIAATIVLSAFFVMPSYQRKGLFNQNTSLANTLLIVGIILYLLIGFFGQVTKIECIQRLLVLPSILFVILSLLLANYSTIHEAVRREGKRPQISKTVIHQNRMMVTGILIFVLLIAGFNWLKQVVFSIVHLIISGVAEVIRWISSFFAHDEIVEEIVQEGAKPDMEMMPPAGDPALFWIILEKVMIGVVVIIVVLLIYSFIKKVIPRIYHWLKKIIEERQSFKMKQSSFEYLEEQESTFQTQKILSAIKKAWMKRQSKRFNERWLDAKTDEEKMRFLYRYYLYQQIKKGIKPKLSQTPKEFLMQDRCIDINTDTIEKLEALYQQARYGTGVDIEEQQLQAFKNELMITRK